MFCFLCVDESKSGPEEINSSEKQSNSQDTPMEDMSSIKEKDNGSSSQTQQPPSNPSPIRKSARLRARFDITDSGSSSEYETKEDSKSKTDDITTTTMTEPHPETVKEENKVESSLKNEEFSTTSEPEKAVTVGREGASLSMDTSDKDSGDETSEDESDDPDKLYCICQQPHDDRYEWGRNNYIQVSVWYY